jgi:hypothetical protein
VYAVVLLSRSVPTAAVVPAGSSAVTVIFVESDSTVVLGGEAGSVDVSVTDGVGGDDTDGFSWSVGFSPCAGTSGSS